MPRGFTEAAAMFDRLPQDARTRLASLLRDVGDEFASAQKTSLATQTNGTGFLGQGIEAEVLIEQLRMRSGLLALNRGKKTSRFYGRFVNFGRKAQNVLVTRGTSGSTNSATSRRRRRDKLSLRKPYILRVRAKAGREFIALPDADARIMRRTADFWSELVPA